MIRFQAIDVKMPSFPKTEVKQWIEAVAASYGKEAKKIYYYFCNDEKILAVNREFLQHDYYTDIITFDYCEGDQLIGEIFISLDTVRSNAEAFQTTYDDELHRVIIHGVLHLCGINDKTPAESRQMKAAENKALALLSVEC